MEPARAGQRSVSFLGGAAIHIDGVPVGGRATHRHPLALLALLTANGGRPLSRDKLIALLWPERDTDAARKLLKVNVHELRKELGDAAVRSTGDQLSADLGVLTCDVPNFLAALAQGDDRMAATLYGGPFLDGFYLKDAAEFERWVEVERAHLSESYASAVERLGLAAERAGDHQAAVRWRRVHAAHDPYRPDVAVGLVQSLVAAGDGAGAIKFAESFAERRRTDLEISDNHDIVTLARRLGSAYTPPGAAEAISALADGSPPSTFTVERAPHLATQRPVWMWLTVGIAAVASVVIVGVASRGTRGINAAPPAVARILVAPFRVTGSDSSIRDALTDLLAARFTGEGGAQAINPAPLASARSTAATQLLTGEIVETRDSVSVAAQIAGIDGGAPIATARAEVGAGGSVTQLADRLAIELMARSAREPDDRIDDLLRRPLISARAFIAADLSYRTARYTRAESLYARALDADSTFAAAGLGLALSNSWTGINEHYGRGRDAAMRYRSDLSARDQAFLGAFFGPDPALGPPRPAPVYLTAWEDVVEKWPDWAEASYQLGDRYFHFGGLSGLADPSDHALSAFRRALQLDSTFAAPLHHLIELYAARRDVPALRAASARYFAVNPSVARDRSAIGWEVAMASGDSAWVRRVRSNLDVMPREDLTRIGWVTDANGWPPGDALRAAAAADRRSTVTSEHEQALILEFTLSVNHGMDSSARRAAAGLGAVFPGQPVAALWDLYAALFGDGDTVLAANAAARLAEFAAQPASGDHVRRDQQHLATCLVGYWQAVRGAVLPAHLAAVRVRSDLAAEDNGFARRNASVCLAMLTATIAERSHASNAGALVAQLDTTLLRDRVPPHAILEAGTIVAARLHAALGDTAAALVAARRREHLTGDPVFLSTELREEALYASAMGDHDGAARARAHLAALRSGH